MLRRISIGIRIVAIIVILLLLILALIATVYLTAENVKNSGIVHAEEVMLEGQKEKVKLGTQTIAHALGKALAGVSDRARQAEIIGGYIDEFRFEADQSGYYFVYRGTVIFVHPILPHRVGEDLGATQDADGVYYVSDLNKAALQGGGFVSFIFPKPQPDGSLINAPKIAYVEMIPGTDLWISTGIYVDNIDAYKADMEQRVSGALVRRMMVITGCLLALLILVVTPLCIFTLRSITKPLRETVRAAEQLASGNLEVKLTAAGNDEIAVLQNSFLRMAASLKSSFARIEAKEAEALAQAEEARKVSGKIMRIAGEVEKSARNMENTVSSIARSAEGVKAGGDTQSDRIREILSSMEQLSAGVLRISQSAGAAADQSKESNKRVEAGVSMAEESGRAMQELHALTGTLTENINKLGEQSNNIGSIMKVISDIADQINLLAMNASIEAAHAGESGRGFGVVAGEVRKLAEKTMNAAQEVNASILDMQKLARVNITGMDNAVSSISRVTGLSEKTAVSLTEAQAIVREAMFQVQSIAAAVEQQSSSSKAVTSLVNDVSGIATDNGALISKVDEELRALLLKSMELMELVSELRR
jgi:methyl-accepting chemotaxis protein